jgi:tetratricopeptide (TPR) repeat protein
VALFRRGKPPSDGEQPDDSGKGGEFVPHPDKARKWFDHAKAMADSYNYDSALVYYAHGIKLDPFPIEPHKAMYDAAIQYLNRAGKPASGKEIRNLEGSHPIEKFVVAEFAWMKDINNGALAMKFLEAAAKAGQIEVGQMHARRVLGILQRQKKLSKGPFTNAMRRFADIGAWDEAIVAGETAMQLDPTDSNLDAELKDLSAQRAMDKGGYGDAAAAEGGFRKFVKDIDKQRELEDAESITSTGSSEERMLQRAKLDYEKNPLIPENINRYAQLLKKHGTPELVEQAHDLYLRGFQDTQEYRFRMAAGDIRIEQAEKQLTRLGEQIASNGETPELKQQADQARQALLKLQREEFEERVEQYPTNRNFKYHLGRVFFELGEHEEAMAQFQAAKDEPKLRVVAAHMLGKSFAAEGWHQEAISEFREALEHVETTEKELDLDIRYDLMNSMAIHAKAERNLELAREAQELCSTIMRKNITYRDIRARRKDLDALLKELSGGG